MEDAEEIQEIMGRSYGMDDIDEDDLEAELEGLEEEFEGLDMDEEEVPSYLDSDALPAVPAGGATGGGGGSGGMGTLVDDNGLPAVPVAAEQ